MNSDEEDQAMLLMCLRRRRRRGRRWHVHPIWQRRQDQGHYANLIAEMRLHDHSMYTNFKRMSPAIFDELLAIVGPCLQAKCRSRPDCLSAGEKLCLSLRYCASGDSMVSLGRDFRHGASTVSRGIHDTLEVNWDELQPLVLTVPTREGWQDIPADFARRWNFPHCFGAIDGKHVVMQAPAGTGSDYFHHKGAHSTVLLAVCDAKYCFTMVDIGVKGRHSDGGIFRHSEFGKHLLNGTLDILPPPLLYPGGLTLPYFPVGDETFPLNMNLMRL